MPFTKEIEYSIIHLFDNEVLWNTKSVREYPADEKQIETKQVIYGKDETGRY